MTRKMTCASLGVRMVKSPVLLLTTFIFAVTACDERSSPSAPDIRFSAIAIENTGVTAAMDVAALAFTYQLSLTLHETAGVRATISQVTVTLTDVSGGTTTNRLSSLQAFGTTQMPANGTLVSSGVAVTGQLPTAKEITVQVAFVDEHGKSDSAQMSTAVKAEFTGDWVGSSTITQPPGDWSLIRISLIQRDDVLTGELVTRDGRGFPLSGCVTCEGAPWVSVGGLPGGSGGCRIGLFFQQFEFRSGQMLRMSSRLGGRCPGTAIGTADLQRST